MSAHDLIKSFAIGTALLANSVGGRAHTSAERIPGERDSSTLTHRQPGAIGGDPYGADTPPVPPEWEDE
jgi:hypothetical protein